MILILCILGNGEETFGNVKEPHEREFAILELPIQLQRVLLD